LKIEFARVDSATEKFASVSVASGSVCTKYVVSRFELNAYDQSTYSEEPQGKGKAQYGSGAATLSAEARRVHPCDDANTEEAELGTTKGRASSFNKRYRGYELYSG
jgi:hypothetical protein